jgi:pilus assembly protein CpaB
MDNFNTKIVIGSVIVAIISVILIFTFTKEENVNNQGVIQTQQLVEVYVANKNIPRRTAVTNKDISIIKIDSQFANKLSVKNPNEIIGKYTTDDVYQGEQFIIDRLKNKEDFYLSANITEGMRAVTIPMTDISSVAYNIFPGDRVDIIGTILSDVIKEKEISRFEKAGNVQTIIQNVKVLDLGIDATDHEKVLNKGELVTLEVTLDDAERIVLMRDNVDFTMVLRNIEDDEYIQTNGIKLNNVIKNKNEYIIEENNKIIDIEVKEEDNIDTLETTEIEETVEEVAN